MQAREFSLGERERVEKYLRLTEEQLYTLIPPYVPEYADNRFSREGQVEAGRTWFANARGELTRQICDEWQMCKRMGDAETADLATLVIVVSDIVATSIAGVPPAIVASIIVRIGLRRFCSCA